MIILIRLSEMGRLTLKVGSAIPCVWVLVHIKRGKPLNTTAVILCFFVFFFEDFNIDLNCLCLSGVFCACMCVHEHTICT